MYRGFIFSEVFVSVTDSWTAFLAHVFQTWPFFSTRLTLRQRIIASLPSCEFPYLNSDAYLSDEWHWWQQKVEAFLLINNEKNWLWLLWFECSLCLKQVPTLYPTSTEGRTGLMTLSFGESGSAHSEGSLSRILKWRSVFWAAVSHSDHPAWGRGDGGCNATWPLHSYARPEKVQQQHWTLAQRGESANRTQSMKGRDREERDWEEEEEGNSITSVSSFTGQRAREPELWTTNEISKSWVSYLSLSPSEWNNREVIQGERWRCGQRNSPAAKWTDKPGACS